MVQKDNGTAHDILTWSSLSVTASHETRWIVEIICSNVVSTLLCMFGIPANILNSLVFWRQGLKDRMNFCLFALAVVDCLYLACTFAMYSISSFIKLFDGVLGEQCYVKSIATTAGVAHGLRSGSGWICTIIALERCACVSYPLHANALIRTSSMCVLVCNSLLLFQILYAFTPFTVCASMIQVGNSTQWVILPTRFHQENAFLVEVMGVTILEIAVPVFTFATVSAATAVTVMKLQTAINWREKATSVSSYSHSRQVALTRMLVLASSVYIVTMVPLVARGLSLLFDEARFVTGTYNDVSLMVNAVVNLCPRVNSSIHFFVYCVRSTRFRNELRTMLGFASNISTQLPHKHHRSGKYLAAKGKRTFVTET